ncbi:hypothetical protein Aperf_G00000028291 [Anoplocephala perfoliata]
MQLLLRRVDGSTLTLNCDLNETVSDVKRQIESMENIPCLLQRLSYGGLSLNDEDVLGHISSSNLAQFDLDVGLLGGAKNRKKKKVEPNGKLNRLRRECPNKECGPGVFMASHFDREYCGKCHKPLSTTIKFDLLTGGAEFAFASARLMTSQSSKPVFRNLWCECPLKIGNGMVVIVDVEERSLRFGQHIDSAVFKYVVNVFLVAALVNPKISVDESFILATDNCGEGSGVFLLDAVLICASGIVGPDNIVSLFHKTQEIFEELEASRRKLPSRYASITQDDGILKTGQ